MSTSTHAKHAVHATRTTHTLPCVVQLGFAGSRRLFEDPPTDSEKLAELHLAVETFLTERLARLSNELKLDRNHFLVSISQVASGADTDFTKACRTLKIPQRICLPQHREAYLSAKDGDRNPDFKPEERAESEALLAAEHIIQERVVSHSSDRSVQFKYTNVEILRVSDVIICLLRENASNKPGGTNQLLERARSRGTAVLEIRVSLKDGKPAFREQWHNIDPNDPNHEFKTPRLPDELVKLKLKKPTAIPPSRDEFCETLDKFASQQADKNQFRFKFAAVVIISTHAFATLLATIAVAFHSVANAHGKLPETGASVTADFLAEMAIPLMLAFEVISLLFGFFVHRDLHHSSSSPQMGRFASGRPVHLVSECHRKSTPVSRTSFSFVAALSLQAVVANTERAASSFDVATSSGFVGADPRCVHSQSI